MGLIPAQRIGIFGGSFDPIHLGHLIVAEAARELLTLDQVWLVPAGISPLKPAGPRAPAADRAAMVRLAIAGNPAFVLCRLELDRPGLSYTVETVAALQSATPDAELVFLAGIDTVRDLPRWHDPARLLALCRLVALSRPETPPLDRAALEAVLPGASERISELAVPEIAISSTDLRRRAAEGRSLRYRVPEAVAAYIVARELYRPAVGAATGRNRGSVTSPLTSS